MSTATQSDREVAIQKILEAASTEIARVGPEALRIGELTGPAGVSRATIYRYFAAKEDLIARVVRFQIEQTLEDVETLTELVTLARGNATLMAIWRSPKTSTIRSAFFSDDQLNWILERTQTSVDLAEFIDAAMGWEF